MRTQKKHKLRQLRAWRIRKTVIGTPSRPRMSVRFTGLHIYVQFIDDTNRVTIASACTRSKIQIEKSSLRANVSSAVILGKAAAEAALSKGISTVVFDRSGARYHGKVKALAESARECGLKF
jgi:large subunit ribosomal protein L18